MSAPDKSPKRAHGGGRSGRPSHSPTVPQNGYTPAFPAILQIYLTYEMRDALKVLAVRQRRPVAAILRELVAAELARQVVT